MGGVLLKQVRVLGGFYRILIFYFSHSSGVMFLALAHGYICTVFPSVYLHTVGLSSY